MLLPMYWQNPSYARISIGNPLADGVRTETFAPIQYVMEYEDLADAIAIQNDVPQAGGLAS